MKEFDDEQFQLFENFQLFKHLQYPKKYTHKYAFKGKAYFTAILNLAFPSRKKANKPRNDDFVTVKITGDTKSHKKEDSDNEEPLIPSQPTDSILRQTNEETLETKSQQSQQSQSQQSQSQQSQSQQSHSQQSHSQQSHSQQSHTTEMNELTELTQLTETHLDVHKNNHNELNDLNELNEVSIPTDNLEEMSMDIESNGFYEIYEILDEKIKDNIIQNLQKLFNKKKMKINMDLMDIFDEE
jgi:hypothetical protein